jgi:flagellar capping protein FliD
VSVELVLNLLAAVGGLGGLATVIGIAYWLGKKFTEIDYRFRLIEERFKTIDERFNRIDERFEEIDKRFDDLKNYIDSRINRLATAFTDYQEFFIEFLTTEGVVRER